MKLRLKRQVNIALASTFIALSSFSVSVAESSQSFSSREEIKKQINKNKEITNNSPIRKTKIKPFRLKTDTETIDVILNGLT